MTTPAPPACQLPVPVAVDDDTGAWSVDGMPVVLVPRHLWVSVQAALEAGLGLAAAQDLFWQTSHAAAWTWCTRQGDRFGLAGAALFAHYVRSASRRGYGRMTVEQLDLARGTARLRVAHSVYVAEYGRNAGRPVCHVFSGSFAGGLHCASERIGLPGPWHARETACAAHGAQDCVFEALRQTT